ncbi:MULTISPECIES: hypothetical protein [Acidithiobacillus]|uniref:Lipoprotein n=2 Tax=Acidithiobacillus TaxID=119977 RepID=A0A179BND0_ACIFR|nr:MULTISPECIES: hypothetical protein [Acidithiobacillus]MEB8475597.1 hypothetical protein [Acidithiobacillus ferriphilus]MEB8487399.1 hypothetical protein [Acidithiobacillus ferriphilus]MEB8490180.1 hypothetical protein [Acidithiobacillus ferriphilus]MEB8493214.1 hypothetical protein [Acidithiobacillus ferriphilus]MEB8514896.1 hypothetical protein [Acidithiobacillus ferriphilus]
MSLKMLTLGALAASALLSGCAVTNMDIAKNSSLRNHGFVVSDFRDRAFSLGSVTLADSQLTPAATHPLPGIAYVKLIRYELNKVFANDHLEDGKKPAFVVNVKISQLHFISDNGFGFMHDITHVSTLVQISDQSGTSIASFKIKPYDAGGYFYGYWHAPSWDYCRRTIPLTAIFTANVLNRLREGKALNNGTLGGEGALIFQKVDDRELGRYGIKSLSKKEIEDITGYSRQQLHDFDKPW